MRLPWQKPEIDTTDIESIITDVFLKMVAHKARKDKGGMRKDPDQLNHFVTQVFETFKANYPGFYREEYRKPLKSFIRCFITLEKLD